MKIATLGFTFCPTGCDILVTFLQKQVTALHRRMGDIRKCYVLTQQLKVFISHSKGQIPCGE